MLQDEEIVMTPRKEPGGVTVIELEKNMKAAVSDDNVAHKGGGANSGITIRTQAAEASKEESSRDLQLEFKCFLVDNKTGDHVPESRLLMFWFRQNTNYLDKVTGAYEFFKQLVRPENFPREYVPFIKHLMKQMRDPNYFSIKKIAVRMQVLKPTDSSPNETGPQNIKDAGDWRCTLARKNRMKREEEKPKEVRVQEQLLVTLEGAYPNIMPMEDLSSMCQVRGVEIAEIQDQLRNLEEKNLIKQMEPGKWVRNVLDNKSEVKIVKQMPIQSGPEKPTIAVITSKYYEKLAVDAMMEKKTTFVRYKTEGESNVYTIGVIGDHRVVSTKLPSIGRARSAQISSGNTTTRLLGTFGDIEHVFLTGVAGGVPHYTDFYKHCRLGDVVVGTPNQRGYLYTYCDQVDVDPSNGQQRYALKSWSPHDLLIQRLAEQLHERHLSTDSVNPAWLQYVTDGQRLLADQQANFTRPPADSDKLYMNIGGKDMIEVGHPVPPPEDATWHADRPTPRAGAVGAGPAVAHDDELRRDFAARHGCVAFDTEFDQVLESIVGNRKDSFAFVRGVADYADGTRGVAWQPYAALVAAAYMKHLILHLPAPGH